MKNTLKLLFLFLPAFAFGQTTAKSILAEYGYVGIPKENAGLYVMFGLDKFRIYADAEYMMVETFRTTDPQDAMFGGPYLQTTMIRERKSNDLYMCVSIDTLRIRMKGGEEEQMKFQQMTGSLNSDSSRVHGAGTKKMTIEGFDCSEVFVGGRFADTVSGYACPGILLDPVIQDFPMQVNQGSRSYGLLLGRDEKLWDDQTALFRVLKLEINQPYDVVARLNSYDLLSKEEGEARLKKAFNAMLGMPDQPENQPSGSAKKKGNKGKNKQKGQ